PRGEGLRARPGVVVHHGAQRGRREGGRAQGAARRGAPHAQGGRLAAGVRKVERHRGARAGARLQGAPRLDDADLRRSGRRDQPDRSQTPRVKSRTTEPIDHFGQFAITWEKPSPNPELPIRIAVRDFAVVSVANVNTGAFASTNASTSAGETGPRATVRTSFAAPSSPDASPLSSTRSLPAATMIAVRRSFALASTRRRVSV